MFLQIAFTALLAQACVGIVYDSYSGKVATEEQIKYFKEKNLIAECTNDIEPCKDEEPRRMDGSCTNPNFPTSGVFHSPLVRVLPAIYKEGTPDQPRLSKSGKPLPNARMVRKLLLAEGKVVDDDYTQLLGHAAVITFADTGSVHDSLNYIRDTTNCCTAEGKDNHMCTPLEVFDTDSTHKFSDIRCLNLTRPKSFQSYGCAAMDTTLNRYEMNTSPLDVSFLYRPSEPVPDARVGKDGLLKVDIEDGSEWPISAGPLNTTCLANIPELGETRCFGVVGPSILPVNLFAVVYYRLHNVIAKELAQLNPHWSDDKIFYTARDIVIAFNAQINFYELVPEMLGKEYALKTGLITLSKGFREVFDPKVDSQATLDNMMVMRWWHTISDGRMKMYDEDNKYWKEEPIVNHSLRIGYFSKDNNYAGILRGSFLQPCGKHDNIVDDHIAETGLGPLQRASDLTSADLEKSRLFGLPPYCDYLDHCGFGKVNEWEDLVEHLGREYTEKLQTIYEHPCDVDLPAGLWGEGKSKDGFMPKTGACILTDQLQRSMRGDMHWFESAKRPNAFTRPQLDVIREVSFASIFCAVENKLKTVTRRPLRRVSKENPLVSCDEIPRWNLSAWKEDPSKNVHNGARDTKQ